VRPSPPRSTPSGSRSSRLPTRLRSSPSTTRRPARAPGSTPSELSSASTNGHPVLHVPATLGGVVLAYNLPGLHTTTRRPARLKLTAVLIGKVYSGAIRRWNDPLIKAVNPGVVLPGIAITPVRRSDGSGTTFIFQSYLWVTNVAWRGILPSGPQQTFPTGTVPSLGRPLPGVGVPRNAGVAARVSSTRGSIGYVEYAYALTGGLHTARIRNRAGIYVAPTTTGFSAAAAASTTAVPADLRILPPVNAAGKTSWPIVGYSFLLVYNDWTSMGATKANMLLSYVYWGLTSGQAYARPLGYAPLPPAIRAKSLAKLHDVQFSGSAIWP
jgi:phosphate transport system substrate-binding protein